MPQASEELRDIIRARFDGLDTAPVENYLTERGWTLTGDWRWKPPTPDHDADDREWECISFLIEEWDYGGPTNYGRA